MCGPQSVEPFVLLQPQQLAPLASERDWPAASLLGRTPALMTQQLQPWLPAYMIHA